MSLHSINVQSVAKQKEIQIETNMRMTNENAIDMTARTAASTASAAAFAFSTAITRNRTNDSGDQDCSSN